MKKFQFKEKEKMRLQPNIYIKLTEEQRIKLEEVCVRKGTTKSSLVRQMIVYCLEQLDE